MRLASFLTAAIVLASCRHSASPEPKPLVSAQPVAPVEPPSASSAPSATPTSTPASAELPPLLAVAWIEHLELPDGHEAYVCPPLAAREPRPLIVAVHGAGDRAEWACGGWRMVAGEYAFVVCPQGQKMDATRFAWDSAETIRRRVESAVAAARARFARYIADGPTLYVGFSQGATLAGPTLLDPAQSFPFVTLAEGGYNLIRDRAFIAKLRARGVTSVLLACGTPGCFTSMRGAAEGLNELGIQALIAGDAAAGHNLNREMQAGLQKVWPDFVAGLANWRGFAKR
ncbi:MAG TPA: PHB depolymerase family esterase [Polyangiaceae bacterium]|nr:PHB depolymerase family esterase [Polyangiaceae bacterium]